jgi:uncharacterized protein (TIGR02266 family)
MAKPKEERRHSKRIAIELWIEAEQKDDLYFHRAANLSAGGAFFAQTLPHPAGTMVNLRFTLPGDSQEIQCKGKVVPAPPDSLGMGVEFVGLKEADRIRIEKLIDNQPG